VSAWRCADRFIDDIGCLPWRISAIARYARARDIPTVKLRAVDRCVKEVTDIRAAAGKWTPPPPPPRGARPDDTVVDGPQSLGGAESSAPELTTLPDACVPARLQTRRIGSQQPSETSDALQACSLPRLVRALVQLGSAERRDTVRAEHEALGAVQRGQPLDRSSRTAS
jgi:hypothetical protein